MDWFWGIDFPGPPFELFGPNHLVALGVVVLINVVVCFFWRHPSEAGRRRFCYGLSAILLINESLFHLWAITTGQWSIQVYLPFHLCSILVYVTPIMLITKNYRMYEFCYFLGLGAAMQALLTPDAGAYDFPHIRFLTAIISHASMVTAALYMTVIEGFRPTWKSLRNTIVALNLYMIPVFILNMLIGSNYLFINRKPDTASMIDMLGPWPWYILSLEAVGLAVFLLLYLPFVVKDWQSKPMPASTGEA
ncbi:MAG: TIGR02206 family membrane protein [Anaerolineae bacterium]|nr:TIGR02206 family membrane protein [Anaerolineae bacterium]